MKAVESSQTFIKQFSDHNLRNSKQDSESHSSQSEKQLIYCDDYSFNQQPSESIRHRSRVYMPGSVDQSEISITGLPELARKYSSIYEQLKDVEGGELMHLFLEEMEDHEKTRKGLATAQAQVKGLQEELVEVRQLLNKKREAIAQLCQTESQHLNLIELLEGQLKNGCFSAEGHFQKKYKMLQSCMNEYIASTNEAQQEFCKRLKLLKNQNLRLVQQIEDLTFAISQQNKKTEVVSTKFQKMNKIIILHKQKQATFTIKIQNLQEQCSSLKKQNDMLRQKIRSSEEFQMELTKQNRELSTELDFIREKINQNQSISRDIFQKMEEQTENTSKMSRQLQKMGEDRQRLSRQNARMAMLLQQTQREREQQLRNREAMTAHFDQMNEQFQKLRAEINQKIRLNEEMKEHIEQLKEELDHLAAQHEELISAYQQEKEDKQLVKGELVNLAEQVRFMEQTYHKEVAQNEKIKGYLQKYWQKREQPQFSINRGGFDSGSKYQRGEKYEQSGERDSLNSVVSVEQ